MGSVVGKELKVFEPVVILLAVYVVNDFLGEKVTAKVLFHHQAVFPHVL